MGNRVTGPPLPIHFWGLLLLFKNSMIDKPLRLITRSTLSNNTDNYSCKKHSRYLLFHLQGSSNNSKSSFSIILYQILIEKWCWYLNEITACGLSSLCIMKIEKMVPIETRCKQQTLVVVNWFYKSVNSLKLKWIEVLLT